jgi:flagellar biogenesis protein FliO
MTSSVWPRLRVIATTLACALTPGLAMAQKLGQAPDTDVAWWRVVAALGLCLALAVAAAFALRTRMRGVVRPVAGGGARQIQLMESLRLSHQVDVCLLRCADQRVLVATSPHGVVLLSSETLTPPPDEAA